jgi:hypothetical protein
MDSIESRARIVLLGGNVDWRTTPIGRNADGILADAKRFLEPEWWRRDRRGAPDLVTVNELLENCGLRRLRSRDEVDPDFKRRRDAQVKKNESYESSTPAAEADDEEEAWEDYLPSPNDNVRQWYEALPKHVDINAKDRRSWFSSLGSYINKFPASAIARDLDQDTICKLVQQICKGGNNQ